MLQPQSSHSLPVGTLASAVITPDLCAGGRCRGGGGDLQLTHGGGGTAASSSREGQDDQVLLDSPSPLIVLSPKGLGIKWA